jgi:hypothetical protein
MLATPTLAGTSRFPASYGKTRMRAIVSRFPSPNTYRVDLIAGTDEQPRKQSGIAS